MMIRTVLCPLDFSDLSLRALEMATDLCETLDAKLVIHHNHVDAGLGAGMRWMWLQERHGMTPEQVAEGRLREIFACLPADLETEAVITRGLAAQSILAVQGPVQADLVLLGTHGPSSDDHTSVTEEVFAGSTCPVLVLHESALDVPRSAQLPYGGQPWSVLVPTDLSPDSMSCVRYALELATVWPIELHLLHVVESAPAGARRAAGSRLEEVFLPRLRALLPPAFDETAQCHVRFGDPAVEIAVAAETLGVDAIVMGTHARGLLRRFLTRDTGLQLLHHTERPIWRVPSSWAV